MGIGTWFEGAMHERRIAAFAVTAKGIPDEAPLTDVDLFFSWLNIDLVHADPKKINCEGLKLDYKTRYFGAELIICSLAVHAVELLNIIRELCAGGALKVPEDTWRQQVVMEDSQLRQAKKQKAANGDNYNRIGQ